MTGEGNCHQCGCVWSVHMHFTYEQHLVTYKEESDEVKRMLDENRSKEEIERRVIKELNETKQQLEKERQRLVEIASLFGSFLKRYATMATSDAIREYIKLNIRDAEMIAASTNVSTLESYEADF